MSTAPTTPRVSTRAVLLALLVLSLLLAGVVSFYASSQPDGLEKVATSIGFIDTATDSMAANSPLADYQLQGVDDDRLAGGAAGIIGSLVVLTLALGLFRMSGRRRGRAAAPSRTG